jgi:hypothetical protein
MGYMRFCAVVTLIATAIAALMLFGTLIGANGAPQEAAGAAIAIAICIIPYVHTRMVQLGWEADRERTAAAATRPAPGNSAA